jgi:hypothetical protein
MNFNGVLPLSVTFSYGEQDVVQDSELAKLALIRAQERKTRLDSKEITPQIAAQRALDAGDLELVEFEAMGYTDLTDSVTLQSSKEIGFWNKLWSMPEAWMPHVGFVPAASHAT